MSKSLFTCLMRKLRHNAHGVVFKEVAASIQFASKSELQELLELINVNHDMEVQVRLLSITAAYLISHGTYTEVIVTRRPLYDRIHYLLKNGSPLQTAKILYFVAALLSVGNGDDPRRRSLVLYARNTIRVSGCLSTMSDMFIGYTMFRDTWVALCHCLAEACRSSEINQSYCARLVQMCVQRCHGEHIEVLALLNSLLNNHEHNIQLFLERNGLSIFTRELLQNDACMQLLNTIVQKSTEVLPLLFETNVTNILGDILQTHGPNSQIGQWSTIILFDIDSRSKGADVTPALNINGNDSFIELQDNSLLMCNDAPAGDDTAQLLQNVVKELSNWKTYNDFKKTQVNANRKATQKSDNFNPSNKRSNETLFTNNISAQRMWPRNTFVSQFGNHDNSHVSNQDFCREKQFSSIQELQKLKNNTIYADQNYGFPSEENYASTQRNVTNDIPMYYTCTKRRDVSNACNRLMYESDQLNVTMTYFKPLYVSTPKKTINAPISHSADVYRPSVISDRKSQRKVHTPYRQCKYSNISSIANHSRSPNVHKSYKQNKYTDLSHNTSYYLHSSSVTNKSKSYTKVHKPYRQYKSRETSHTISYNKSMGNRFLSAINDTCTTLVKSVKNMFKTKVKTPNHKEERHKQGKNVDVVDGNSTCSYSFTNFMRMKDASNECTLRQSIDFEEFSKDNTCRTCDDTVALKRKMADNEHLKQTVKKLKLGINVYGCDFKKISKVMWPRETYVTPRVLYNIYRKLLVNNK